MARLLQLTDLHVVAPGALASGVVDTRALLRAGIDHLIDRLDAIGPIDAVLVTGDVSDDGSDESYAFTRAQLERLGRRILIVQIGRASCRARVCQYVEISGVAVSLKKKKKNTREIHKI